MAESVRRRSWGGVLPLGRHASISGSSLVHCASVSIAPPHPRGAKRPSSQPVQARTGPRRPLDGWSELAAPSVRVEIGSPNLHRCECGETQAGAPITTLVPQLFHSHLTIIKIITYVSVSLSFWRAAIHEELLVCCDGTVRVGAH